MLVTRQSAEVIKVEVASMYWGFKKDKAVYKQMISAYKIVWVYFMKRNRYGTLLIATWLQYKAQNSMKYLHAVKYSFSDVLNAVQLVNYHHNLC